jgi:hypothetical protein
MIACIALLPAAMLKRCFEKRIGLKRIPDNKGFPDFDSENPDF